MCSLNSDLDAESIGNLKSRFNLCLQTELFWKQKAEKSNRPLKQFYPIYPIYHQSPEQTWGKVWSSVKPAPDPHLSNLMLVFSFCFG